MVGLGKNLFSKSPLKIVILGGGVSGLSSAHTVLQLLRHHNTPVSVTLLESDSRLGGWINTVQYSDGCYFELGPRTLRCVGAAGYNTLQLVEELGIENDVLPVTSRHPSASKRYIYAKGKMNMLPSKILTLFKVQPPLTKSIISSLVKEPFQCRSQVSDESVHDFVSRRVGREVAKYLVDSLCRGVFASGSKELSINACFPSLAKYEKDFGSIILGAMFSKEVKVPTERCLLYERSKKEKWRIFTFKNGMETLVDSWVPYLQEKGLDIRVGTGCRSLDLTTDNKLLCTTSKGIIEADHVISAISASTLGLLLPEKFEDLKASLNEVQSVTVGVVNLEYEGNVLPVNGFGFLVPSCEPMNILGVVFDSCVMPQKTSNTKLTVMLGGSKFQELFGNPDNADEDHIKQVALNGIKETLGIATKPTKCLVSVQKNCIPQYRVGHLEKVDKIRHYVNKSNIPLTLVGSSYNGVGINDCIYNAKMAVELMLKFKSYSK